MSYSCVSTSEQQQQQQQKTLLVLYITYSIKKKFQELEIGEHTPLRK